MNVCVLENISVMFWDENLIHFSLTTLKPNRNKCPLVVLKESTYPIVQYPVSVERKLVITYF